MANNRQGTGRKKIDIKKMDNKHHIKTTFTKRRKGLFKKLNEYCNTFGVDAAVVTFSPYGRSYACAFPSLSSVIDRFLSENSSRHDGDGGDDDGQMVPETTDESSVRESGENRFCWWEKSVQELEPDEVEQYRDFLLQFRKNVADKLEKLQNTRVGFKGFFAN